jgi:prepilin-type N-terminal cleavage/methylation domain-containing protein
MLRKVEAFTLVELIIVVIIVGILASLGLTQYANVVEKTRMTEAKMNIGVMRKLMYEYSLQNGDATSITSGDLGVGTGSSDIPSSCRSTDYFSYTYWGSGGGGLWLVAARCSSGGKAPQHSCYRVAMNARPDGSIGSTYARDQCDNNWVYLSNWPNPI